MIPVVDDANRVVQLSRVERWQVTGMMSPE